MADVVTHATDLGKGQTVETRLSTKEKTVPFISVGESGRYNMSRFPVYEDFSGTMGDISKGASWMFWLLVKGRNYKTNESEYIPSKPRDRAKVQRAYKELVSRDLVARVRRGCYLLNPGAIVPPIEYHEAVYRVWCPLITKCKGGD